MAGKNLSRNECKACGTEFESPRADRRWCAPECKRALKRQYDRDRYPMVADEAIRLACEWQRNNKARKSAYDAQYRIRTADRRREIRAKYTPIPDKQGNRLRSSQRRARKRGNGEFRVGKSDLYRALVRARELCTYCSARVTWDSVEWDHVVPISRGGCHSIGNLVPSCRSCNRSKGRSTVTEWRARQRRDSKIFASLAIL